MTLNDIQRIMEGTWIQCHDADAEIGQLNLDTRQVSMPAVSLFFAIKGLRHDAHHHLQEAWRQGIRHFIVSQSIDLGLVPESNVIQVRNTLMALQILAGWHRQQFQLPIIGITGSNGKTVVKEWLWQLLSPDFNIVRSPKSYNSQVGVPLSLWQIQAAHTLGIIEAGISQTGEMAALESMIRPDIGIFTNIGTAHREGFKDDEEKVQEKMRLFQGAKKIIYCQDNALIHQYAALTQAERSSWSRIDTTAALYIDSVASPSLGFTKIEGFWGRTRTPISFTIPFTDEASIENAIHCACLILGLGIDPDQMGARMLRLEPVEMRLELKAAIHGCMLINDAYSNDLSSLRIALQFARQQVKKRKLTLILSDILQSGEASDTLWPQVADIAMAHQVNRVIGVGQEAKKIGHYLKSNIETLFFETTDALLAEIGALDFQDELILLKGARKFAFERLAHRLEQKAHKTVLEVDLSAMIHNLNIYNQRLKPGTSIMAMVKAAGYGSGSREVAKLLEFHKVDYLGVAYADEGIELRQSGVTLPIMVLNPEPSGFDALYRYRLEPEIYSLNILRELLAYTGQQKQMSIHLKLDTGMHRLGFEQNNLDALHSQLKNHPNIYVNSIFTHLSASDNPTHDDFTHQQASTFGSMYESLAQSLDYRPKRHICNTSGIVRFPQYHYEMVRLGIGLYGIDSSGILDQLRVVNVLKATISQIKEIPVGDTVGYNRNSGILEVSRRIATISIGYADGLLRLAGGGRYSVMVGGQKAPTIGNICMDMTMIDITQVPTAREGDEVIIFGEDPSVETLAIALQSIPYEIFTNIADRVKRVYWQ